MTEAPQIRDIGLTGLLVSFGNSLTSGANRAALAFRAAVDAATWNGVEETSTSLTSTYVRYDPLSLRRADLAERLTALLESSDWENAPYPEGWKRWRIPVALGGDQGPQFAEAADAAGLSEDQAADEIAAAELRVLTIGFAPGQGYLGALPPHWDVPRLTQVTPHVPQGALVTAIRQLIIFARPTQTGWLHIGQTAFRSFDPTAQHAFALTPGDAIRFEPVSEATLARFSDDPNGGATSEAGA
ncbi:MAG: carboxyltransferase domain-containing protein [Pseudomonadota bacterium]